MHHRARPLRPGRHVLSISCPLVALAALATVNARPASANEDPASSHPSAQSPHGNDRFGAAIALEGDRLLIGALGANDVGFDAGAVHVYERRRDQWRRTQTIYAPTPAPLRYFGAAIALAGDHALILDYQTRPYTGWPRGRGQLDLFEARGSTWEPVGLLGPGEGLAEDEYVTSVAVDGDRAALTIGPTHEIMILDWSGDAWDQTVRLAPWEEDDDFSGDSIALAGDHLLVGGGFSAAALTRAGAGWERVATLRAEESRGYTRVDLDDARALVGDRVFRINAGGEWIIEADLLGPQPLDPSPGPHEYLAGSLDDERVVLHRNSEFFVYTREGDSWREEGRFERPQPDTENQWELASSDPAVALDGETIVVGSPDDCFVATEAGVAHVFTSEAGWSRVTTLYPNDEVERGGCSVAPPGERGLPALALLALALVGRRRRRRRRRARPRPLTPLAAASLLALCVMIANTLSLLAPAPAEACSVAYDPAVYIDEESTRAQLEAGPLPTDGVLALTVHVFDHESLALAQDALTVVVRDGDTPVPGTIELHELAHDPSSGTYWRGALAIWRPEQPLAANHTYTLESNEPYEDYSGAGAPFTATFTTGAGPHAPLGELSATLRPTTADVEVLEEACCDHSSSSCGYAYACEWSSMRTAPALELDISLTGGEPSLGRVWAVRVDPSGELLPPDDPLSGGPAPISEELWLSFSAPPLGRGRQVVVFPDAQDEYCVVLGATSLIDGETITSAPQCAPRSSESEPGERERGPEELAELLAGSWGCSSAPVYKSTGAPLFPTEEEPAGCRVTQTPRGLSGWTLLLLLLPLPLLRRRR